MAKPSSLPSYSHHKPSGQARARIHGRDVYLGPYGSAESKEAFAQLLLELARQETAAGLPQPTGNWQQNPQFKVKELILKYTLFAREYYGAKASEYVTMREALKPVLELFGSLPAKDFGPKILKCVLVLSLVLREYVGTRFGCSGIRNGVTVLVPSKID